MTKTILIATNNKGKLRELYALFANSNMLLKSPQDLSISLQVKETGSTYKENSNLKAVAFCEASGLPTLADDTGLEVEVLNGAPGLYSARYSPKINATDADRRALLLNKLNAYPQPWKARFVCVMAFILPGSNTYYSTGVCDGEIINIERGKYGFGYDPIFLCKDINLTLAELDMEHKNRISHRARAANAIFPTIRSLLSLP